ncbi:hypothetical protein Emed_000699 [Eimeria media]
MGPHGLTDIVVEGGHVHKVLFADLLQEGSPCLVLVLPRLLRVYTVCNSAWGPRGGPPEEHDNAAEERPLRFLCEMHLHASVLDATVIPCSKTNGPVSCSEGRPQGKVGEAPSFEGDKLSTDVNGASLAALHASAPACGARGPCDLLLLLFGGYRAAVVGYDETLGALRTVSMHCFAELEPRAAAVHALLTGPLYVKPVDEAPSSDADDRPLGSSDGAPTVAASQLPASLLRSACKVHVFPLDSFTDSVALDGLHGRYGKRARNADSKDFLAVLSVDLLHVVCLQLSVKIDGFRKSSVFGADGFGVTVAQADAAGGNAWGQSMQVDGPSYSRGSPLPPSLCHPSVNLTTAAATTSKGGSSSLLASPWSRGQGLPSHLGGLSSPGEREHLPPNSTRGPQSSAANHLNALPPVAFLAAAVHRQQHRQGADGIDDGSTGSAASELGDARGPSLWGAHSVLVSGLAIASCFFFSLLEDIPLPPPAASAVAGAAAPRASALKGDCAAAAANAETATAGAAGLPYVLLDLVGVASLLCPAVALLLAEGPRELGLLPFAGAPGAGEVFALLLALNPHEKDVQLVGKIPGLLGDTFRLLSVPGLADGLLCLSSNSLSFFSFRGGYCGGGTQQLPGSHQADSTDSNYNRTLGITHILHPAGLVRKDLVQLPSVVFDKSALRLRLDGAAAVFVEDRCLFLLAADGRPALAHLVMPAGLTVTDFLWTSVEILSPTASVEGPKWGLPTVFANEGLLNAEGVRGQLLLPRSDSVAVYPLEGSMLRVATVCLMRLLRATLARCCPFPYETASPAADDAVGRTTRSGNTKAPSRSRSLIALGGRIRDGTGVCLVVAEGEPVMTPRLPWGGASGTSRDLHCDTSAVLADEALATGVASLEMCCSLVSELNQGRARQQQQQDLYTTSGKQLMELSPDGSIALAQQKAPILRHSELQEDEALWSGVTDKALGPGAGLPSLSSPFGYLRWLKMQQEYNLAASAVEPLRAEGAAYDPHGATAVGFGDHTSLALSSMAAAPLDFQSDGSTTCEEAGGLLVDALGLIKASEGGHSLLLSVRLSIVDRLSLQGLLSPRCITYLPAPPVPTPLAASAAQPPKQQAIEELCSSSGGSRFLVAGGSWPHGALGALQRAVPCRSLAALSVAEGNPRIIWALQLEQHQSALLLASSDPRMGLGESRLFCFRGGALVDETAAEAETGGAGDKSGGCSIGQALCTEAPTLFAASVLEGRVLLQLTADELRVLDSSGSRLLCPPIDMSEDSVQQHQQQQQEQAFGGEADTGEEFSMNAQSLANEHASAPPLQCAELNVDGESSHLQGVSDDATAAVAAANADESSFAAADAGWEKEMPQATGGLAAAVRGSAAENWVCVVLDDFRLRLWYIDAAAAESVANTVQTSSVTDCVPDASPLLHEVPLSAMPHCMRNRVKSAHLYAHPRTHSALEEMQDGGMPAASDVFCCLVTVEGPKQAQALHAVSLQQMKCVFSSDDLRLVSPLLRNCGSCSQHQLRQGLKEHLQRQHFLHSQHPQYPLRQGGVGRGDGVTASSSGTLAGAAQTGGAADGVTGDQEGLGQYAAVIAGATDAAAANLAELGSRDARRSVTCITATPLSWALSPNESSATASAHISEVGSVSAAGGPEVVAASAGGNTEQATATEDETKEEVLSAELLLLDPAEDAGPTLVVFLTGRPPLLYRAFCPVPAFASGAPDDARVEEMLPITGAKLCEGTPNRSLTDATLLALVGNELFPWAFQLVVNDCTQCIPSAQTPSFARASRMNEASTAAAAPPEVSVHFAVSSGYTTVPQQAPLLGGGVALVIPPLPLPETDELMQHQQLLERPPILWLCSSRNQLHVHPNERRDSLSAAPFHWNGEPRGSFAFLCGRVPTICLSVVATPFDSTCKTTDSAGPAAASSSSVTGPSGDEAAAAQAGSMKMGPFRLDGSIPFSSFSLGASPTHVAVSSGSSYLQPPEALGGAKAGQTEAVAAPGRLVAVAVHHQTEEAEQIREVLESRNALQRAHVALQSRAGASEAAGAAGEKGALDEGGSTAAAHLSLSNSSESGLREGSLLSNPYLAACADGRVEVAGEVGKQQEILLFHQDDLLCPIGEAVETGGRLLLLRLPSLLLYGQQAVAASSTSGETAFNEEDVLRLFCSFVFPGPVSVVGDFAPSGAERHYLLHSVGRRLFTHEIDGDLLARGAFADVGISITAVTTLKHFIVTGDLFKGLSLLAWRFDASSDSRRLELVSRTIPHWLLPVTACEAMTEKDELGLLASDPWGNIRFFFLNQTADPGVSILQQLQESLQLLLFYAALLLQKLLLFLPVPCASLRRLLEHLQAVLPSLTAAQPLLRLLHFLRCDHESMESESPIVAFKQLLSEAGDVACLLLPALALASNADARVFQAGWSAEGGLLSFRLIDAEQAGLLRKLQEWLEMCLPSECGLKLTAARVPAGPPSPHLRLWAAEQQQRLRQQLQQLLLQQYCNLDEDSAATSTALAAAAFASGEAAETSWLLQQLDGSALAALRSYLPISASQLRSFPFLSVPVQQRLVSSAAPSLVSLLQSRFQAANGEMGAGAPFSWAALRKALAAGPLGGFDLPAVPLS